MYLDEKAHGEALLDPIGRSMLAAADAIALHGHAKYALRSSKSGGLCLLGALNLAESGSAESGPAHMAYNAARRMGFSGLMQAVNWNNAPDTTALDVISALRASAGQTL